MVGARPKAQDFTGRERERLIKENHANLAKRAEEMSIATVLDEERIASEVVDYTESVEAPTVIDTVESVGVALSEEQEIIQPLEDLEQMTLGVGNHYDFKAGRKYKVPAAVARHLREKGYIY